MEGDTIEVIEERVVYDWNHQGRSATVKNIRIVKRAPAAPPPPSWCTIVTSSAGYEHSDVNRKKRETVILDYNHEAAPIKKEDVPEPKENNDNLVDDDKSDFHCRKRKLEQNAVISNPACKGPPSKKSTWNESEESYDDKTVVGSTSNLDLLHEKVDVKVLEGCNNLRNIAYTYGNNATACSLVCYSSDSEDEKLPTREVKLTQCEKLPDSEEKFSLGNQMEISHNHFDSLQQVADNECGLENYKDQNRTDPRNQSSVHPLYNSDKCNKQNSLYNLQMPLELPNPEFNLDNISLPNSERKRSTSVQLPNGLSDLSNSGQLLPNPLYDLDTSGQHQNSNPVYSLRTSGQDQLPNPLYNIGTTGPEQQLVPIIVDTVYNGVTSGQQLLPNPVNPLYNGSTSGPQLLPNPVNPLHNLGTSGKQHLLNTCDNLDNFGQHVVTSGQQLLPNPVNPLYNGSTSGPQLLPNSVNPLHNLGTPGKQQLLNTSDNLDNFGQHLSNPLYKMGKSLQPNSESGLDVMVTEKDIENQTNHCKLEDKIPSYKQELFECKQVNKRDSSFSSTSMTPLKKTSAERDKKSTSNLNASLSDFDVSSISDISLIPLDNDDDIEILFEDTESILLSDMDFNMYMKGSTNIINIKSEASKPSQSCVFRDPSTEVHSKILSCYKCKTLYSNVNVRVVL